VKKEKTSAKKTPKNEEKRKKYGERKNE